VHGARIDGTEGSERRARERASLKAGGLARCPGACLWLVKGAEEFAPLGPDSAPYTRSRSSVAALALDEPPGAGGRASRPHPTVRKRRAGRDRKLVATAEGVRIRARS
jgi:hypothetical protein